MANQIFNFFKNKNHPLPGQNIEPKVIISIADLGGGRLGIKSAFTDRGMVLDLLLTAVKTLALADDKPRSNIVTTEKTIEVVKN